MESACVLLLAVLIGSNILEGSALRTISERVGIYYGNNASISQYPYMAAVVNESNSIICSGVILNETWILTTAFSIFGMAPSEIKFRVGSDWFDVGGQLLGVSKIVIHENYTGDVDYDIALVKVHKMKMGTNVTAVQLGTTTLKAGTKVKIAGWGSKTPGEFSGNEHLLDATLKVMSWKTCRKYYPNDVSKFEMCTIYKLNSPTYGDFGDPLVYDGKVYGLWAGVQEGSPDVFVSLPAYIDWIYGITRQ